jgi:hypothetical protein
MHNFLHKQQFKRMIVASMQQLQIGQFAISLPAADANGRKPILQNATWCTTIPAAGLEMHTHSQHSTSNAQRNHINS